MLPLPPFPSLPLKKHLKPQTSNRIQLHQTLTVEARGSCLSGGDSWTNWTLGWAWVPSAWPGSSSRPGSGSGSACNTPSAPGETFPWSSRSSPRRPISSSAAGTSCGSCICRRRLRECAGERNDVRDFKMRVKYWTVVRFWVWKWSYRLKNRIK